MKRWKAAAVLALCTVLLLQLTQVQAHPVGESPYVPVLGIVTTAAADDRCEAQSAALVHAAADSGFKVLEMPVERTQEAQIEALRADHLSGGCDRVHAAGGKRLGQCTAGGKVGLRAADRGRSFGARCGGGAALSHRL